MSHKTALIFLSHKENTVVKENGTINLQEMPQIEGESYISIASNGGSHFLAISGRYFSLFQIK